MTSLRFNQELSRNANAIWEAVSEASPEFMLDVDQHGRLDLVDQETGQRTPIATVKVIK